MVEEKLKAALVSMQNGIRSSDDLRVSESLSALDDLLKAHRAELDPQLVHYLSRRSYEKALMHLDGKDGIPKGVCGK